MRPDQKYMPDFARHDKDDDFDNDMDFNNEDGIENDDINLVPFNTQLPYNVLATGWIPVFIFDNLKNPSNITANMSATIPNSPMGVSNPFGPQFTMPNLSNLGGSNLGTQNLNCPYSPMGTTPNVPGSTYGYNPWSTMSTTPGSMPGGGPSGFGDTTSTDTAGTGMTGGIPGEFGGTFGGTFSGTSTMGATPSGFGGTPGTSMMGGTPGTGMMGGMMGGTPGTGMMGGMMGGTPGTGMTGSPIGGNTLSSTLDEDLVPYNINAMNYTNPRLENDITEIIKNFDLDLDEDIDLTRVNPDKRIDAIFSSITQKHEEIVSLLRAYNMPFPIIKLLIRKIIKLTLFHGKREEE